MSPDEAVMNDKLACSMTKLFFDTQVQNDALSKVLNVIICQFLLVRAESSISAVFVTISSPSGSNSPFFDTSSLLVSSYSIMSVKIDNRNKSEKPHNWECLSFLSNSCEIRSRWGKI